MALSLAPAQAGAAEETPTYNQDVGPILLNNCARCHRPDQIAPMPLLSYKDARRRSAMTSLFPPGAGRSVALAGCLRRLEACWFRLARFLRQSRLAGDSHRAVGYLLRLPDHSVPSAEHQSASSGDWRPRVFMADVPEDSSSRRLLRETRRRLNARRVASTAAPATSS